MEFSDDLKAKLKITPEELALLMSNTPEARKLAFELGKRHGELLKAATLYQIQSLNADRFSKKLEEWARKQQS